MPLTRADYLLLALGSTGGRPLDPAQMQKVLFLFGKRSKQPPENFYTFGNHHYGAYSREIPADARSLERRGLVTVQDGQVRAYSTTPLGQERADLLKAQVPEAATFLQNLSDWALRLTFAELIKAVYKAYPDTRENSVFRS